MQPPIRIMEPGRVYRNDYDQPHTPMFHQIELLYVDKKSKISPKRFITISTLSLEKIYKVRFRPSYFPHSQSLQRSG